MNAITSLNTLDQARAEMEQMARDAVLPESARGWWHAARIVRLFGNAARAMKQQAQLARFFATSVPEKAAAYREAMRILARHTGESLVAHEAAACEQSFAFDFGDGCEARATTVRTRSIAKASPEFKSEKRLKKRGSGSVGWRGVGTQGGPVVVAGLAGAFPSCRPSHRSRSLLHEPDLFTAGFIPFIGG